MRVVSLHQDVLVATSAIWQTNCVIVRGGAIGEDAGRPAEPARPDERSDERGMGETFVIDSPILPDELEALPAVAKQAGFPSPSGLLVTHGDWDHLLGRLTFPSLALGCAESTVRRLNAIPGEAQRELRAFDKGLYIERPRPLMLGQLQALPVPGRCAIGGSAGADGGRELELHPADGHTPDGMAISIGWAGVLVVGDYLSTVEPPEPGKGSSAAAYLTTLERMRPLIEAAEHVVPGHGPVLSADRALDVLAENAAAL